MYRRRCAAIPENGFGDGSTNGSQTGDQTPGTGNPNGSQTGNQTPSDTPGTAPAAGTRLTDPSGTAFYLVTKSGAEAAYAGTVNKNASSASIPAAVTIDGISYQVTSIAANAFAGQKQLKSVSVGKRVASIGNKAFYNCRELTRITIPARACLKNAFWQMYFTLSGRCR